MGSPQLFNLYTSFTASSNVNTSFTKDAIVPVSVTIVYCQIPQWFLCRPNLYCPTCGFIVIPCFVNTNIWIIFNISKFLSIILWIILILFHKILYLPIITQTNTNKTYTTLCSLISRSEQSSILK